MNKISDKLKQNMYYVIIGVVSFVALIFLPFLGSDLGMGWKIPNTTVGWIVFVVTRLIISVINILIFHSFLEQGKLNVKENPQYKEAVEILSLIKEKDYIPRSPKKWKTQTYGKKGVTIFFSSALATVALTQAILSFDWTSMLSYLFTIIMGLIFGVLQMKASEEYWTEEFNKYAKLYKKELAEKEKAKEEENVNTRRQDLPQPTRTSISESTGVGTSETDRSDSGSGNQNNECGESVLECNTTSTGL